MHTKPPRLRERCGLPRAERLSGRGAANRKARQPNPDAARARDQTEAAGPQARGHGQFRHIRMTKAGTYLVAHLNLGKVREYDRVVSRNRIDAAQAVR